MGESHSRKKRVRAEAQKQDMNGAALTLPAVSVVGLQACRGMVRKREMRWKVEATCYGLDLFPQIHTSNPYPLR